MKTHRASGIAHLAAALGMSLVLVACGSGMGTGAATTPTQAPTTTHPGVKVTVAPGDTNLCNIISVSEFSQAVGGGVSTLKASSGKGPTGATLVNCSYLPPTNPGPGGAIDFAVASDGPAYFALIQQEEADQLNSVNALSGVGDAAFWGTDKNSPDILNLDMLKDNVVVGIDMDGSAADGSAYLAAAEQIAKKLTSKL